MEAGGEQKKPEIYKKKKKLGEGNYGTAYLVDCKNAGGQAVIKQIDIGEMDEEERKETFKEAKILEILDHPNIVKFMEVYPSKKGKLCIVMEYADNGDLQGHMKKQIDAAKKSGGDVEYWSQDKVLNWFTQICLGVKHVHDRKILHRDIKSQNIFVTKSGKMKLGDFGIARVLNSTMSKAKTVMGTPYYLSPEIVSNEPYNFKSDIWSLGVLLYEMCAFHPPFQASNLRQLCGKIKQGKYPPLKGNFDKDINNLIGSLLILDADKRPNINQILKHPAINSRINSVLDPDVKEAELGHTILHGINPFANSDASQVQKEEEKYEAEILKRKETLKKDALNQEQRDEDHDEGETKATKTYQEDINLVGVDQAEFEKKMGERYGEKQFKEGYAVVLKYKDDLYSKEDQIKAELKNVGFKSDEELEDFLNNSSTYLIINNIKN